MRDCICTVVEGIDRANELAEAIANKLFGDGENDRCEKAVPRRMSRMALTGQMLRLGGLSAGLTKLTRL